MAKKKTVRTKKVTAVNGSKRRITVKARSRILTRIRRQGYITNEQARESGRFKQVWYHLAALAQQGYIQHAGYNLWEVTKRGRQKKPYAV